MKKNNIILFLLMALPTLLLTSCLKDQEDLFPESASARTTKYLANVQKVLTSSENGWVLDYFPDREQSYGGYAYTLKFDEENVKVGFELAGDPSLTLESTYTLNNEGGPVLMFDTYNEFMHFFSTPSGSSGAGGYEAYDGDFIFIVMGISEDENTITLKGNRSGNIMYMHRLTESMTDYMATLADFQENLVFDQALAEIDGKHYLMNISARSRSLSIETEVGEDEEPVDPIEAPFCFDKDGFSLYESVAIGDKLVRVFKYDENEGIFIAEEDKSVVFAALLTPSIVINNVGEGIYIGNGAVTKTYTFNLADKFTYTSDVDWITVSAEGKKLTVNVAANNTGKERTGYITVEANGEKATISVTQMPLSGMFINSEAYVALSNISPAAQPYFLACKALSDSEGETISTLLFVNIGGENGYGIYFVSGNYAGLMALDTELIGDKEIKFTYASKRNNSNGNWYYSNGYNALVNYLVSTSFVISADDEDNPSYYILTDKNDPTKYFKLTTAEVSNPFAK